MAAIQTLREALVQLDTLEDEDMIFVDTKDDGWLPESQAIIQSPNEIEERYPRRVGDLSFFIHAALAREVIEDWGVSTNRELIPVEEQVKLLIYYVEHDAAPAPNTLF